MPDTQRTSRAECLRPGCANQVDPDVNPLWCPECNQRRIERISKRLDQMAASFHDKHTEGEQP